MMNDTKDFDYNILIKLNERGHILFLSKRCIIEKSIREIKQKGEL